MPSIHWIKKRIQHIPTQPARILFLAGCFIFGISLDKKVYSAEDTVRATFTLSNTGKYNGVEVAQLYVRDLVGSVTRPVKELKYFERIALEAGESREITFELPVRELAFWNMDMEKVVEPGAFRLWIAGDSASGEAAEFSVE